MTLLTEPNKKPLVVPSTPVPLLVVILRSILHIRPGKNRYVWSWQSLPSQGFPKRLRPKIQRLLLYLQFSSTQLKDSSVLINHSSILIFGTPDQDYQSSPQREGGVMFLSKTKIKRSSCVLSYYLLRETTHPSPLDKIIIINNIFCEKFYTIRNMTCKLQVIGKIGSIVESLNPL